MRKDRNSGKFRKFRVFRLEKKTYSLNFWQNFLLTMAGACGLISMVADGPRWITYPSLIIVIVLLLSIIKRQRKTNN
jgi:hypothetical protein